MWKAYGSWFRMSFSLRMLLNSTRIECRMYVENKVCSIDSERSNSANVAELVRTLIWICEERGLEL